MKTNKKKIVLVLAIVLAIALGVGAFIVVKSVIFENAHTWNQGELTSDEEITYTCTDEGCQATKVKKISKGQVVTTREDLEDALATVALAYYMKGEQVQYDSGALNALALAYGGTNRLSYGAAPEYGTEDTTIYSVCSDYIDKVYREALDITILDGPQRPAGLKCSMLWLHAENQQQSSYETVYGDGGKEALDDKDVDTALVRWCDFATVPYNWNTIDEEIRFGVFESNAFTDFTKLTESSEDDNLEFKATGKTVKDSNGNEVPEYAYYLDGKEISATDVTSYVRAYATENNYANLRVGDMFVDDLHTVMYIGDGYFLDCYGSKFDRETGVDEIEKRGVRHLLTVEYVVSQVSISRLAIMRPLDGRTTDYDGNPGNDVVNIEIPETTKSRMEYPAIEIDRTVDITPYGTVSKGEEMTYSVKITNNSTDTVFQEWYIRYCKRQDIKFQSQVKYEDLTVTETVPEGTELVPGSIVGGGNYDSKTGKITWTIDIEGGASETLSYKVKATADIGATITNDGGYVANIPSNSITNTVGGTKLDDKQKDSLKSLSQGTAWQNGSELAFAKNIYANAGIDLTMSDTVSETVEKIFGVKEHSPKRYNNFFYSSNSADTEAINMFVRKGATAEGDDAIANMLVNRYYGGYRFYVGDDSQYQLDATVLECRKDYLEPGDIIVYATAQDRSVLGMSNAFASTTVMVYDGENLLAATSLNGATTYNVYSGEDVEQKLTTALIKANDLFFALRPSQAGVLGK